MATREPRRTAFRIDWSHETLRDGSPKWTARIGGVRVAEAVMTGRKGVDDYPWDWYLTDAGEGLRQRHPGKNSGVTDTLRQAKADVLYILQP